MRHILVVEPDEGLRQIVQLALRQAGFEAEGVATAAAASRALEAWAFAVVVAPAAALAGAELRRRRDAAVIALVAPGDGAAGLTALRQGAADYVARGPDAGPLVEAVRKAEARADAARRAPDPPPADAAAPAGEAATAAALAALVGDAEAMRALKAAIARVAPHKTTVLLRGESGTGKEVVARALHRASPRAAAPFVAVDCGAIPPGLLESELFGHRRGAFTDAVRDRQGLVEQAAGGTLFLDEIAELSAPLQVKLLRVLQDQRIRRLGEEADVAVDVRVVAATARPLEAEVAAGRFREDLLYRLDVISLRLPALRERAADIPALAAHFLGRVRARLGLAVGGIAPDALEALVAYPWPGNVRELENTIERAAVLCEGPAIHVASLPERFAPAAARTPAPVGAAPADEDADLSIKRAARRAEESLIRRALLMTGGNRTRAAELLEISHRALLYKIKEYGIN
jgi:two-component system response regulator AtoC